MTSKLGVGGAGSAYKGFGILSGLAIGASALSDIFESFKERPDVDLIESKKNAE
jgi:hypothetical protein